MDYQFIKHPYFVQLIFYDCLRSGFHISHCNLSLCKHSWHTFEIPQCTLLFFFILIRAGYTVNRNYFICLRHHRVLTVNHPSMKTHEHQLQNIAYPFPTSQLLSNFSQKKPNHTNPTSLPPTRLLANKFPPVRLLSGSPQFSSPREESPHEGKLAS